MEALLKGFLVCFLVVVGLPAASVEAAGNLNGDKSIAVPDPLVLAPISSSAIMFKVVSQMQANSKNRRRAFLRAQSAGSQVDLGQGLRV